MFAPTSVMEPYLSLLDRHGISGRVRQDYCKWLRYYLDFCHKYGHESNSSASIAPFLEKLGQKGQTDDQRRQARQAIGVFLGIVSPAQAGSDSGAGAAHVGRASGSCGPA